ncbi:hypothetical protein [Halosimplex sp. J119]
MESDDGGGEGGQEGFIGSGMAKTSDSTEANLDSLGYAVADTTEPDGGAGSPTHIAIKVFVFVGLALLLTLFLLGSGLF